GAVGLSLAALGLLRGAHPEWRSAPAHEAQAVRTVTLPVPEITAEQRSIASEPSRPLSPPIAAPVEAPSETGAAPAAAVKEVPRAAAPSAVRREPTWVEVSDALSSGDAAKAEGLLSDLARRGSSADTRAKAKLGLAQLAASHGDCEKAKRLSL